jgi:hypothetical protein
MIAVRTTINLVAKVRSWFAQATHRNCAASRDPRISTPHVLPKLGLLADSLLLAVLCAAPEVVRAEFNFALQRNRSRLASGVAAARHRRGPTPQKFGAASFGGVRKATK